MVQIKVHKNFIDEVMIDGGFRVNITTENLKMQLNLSKLNPTPHYMWMGDQTIAKPLALIENRPFSTSPLSIICHFLLHFRLQIFKY